jgi:hypothetical protein
MHAMLMPNNGRDDGRASRPDWPSAMPFADLRATHQMPLPAPVAENGVISTTAR